MKLGPHVLYGTPYAREWANNAPIIKQVDRVDALYLARADVPVVFRRWFPKGDQDWIINNMTPQDAARFVLEGIKDNLDGFHPTGRPFYIEGLSETHQRLTEGLERYADFTEAFVARAHNEGYQVAGFTFSTGNPGFVDMDYVQSRGFCGVDALCLNEYWGKWGHTAENSLRHNFWLDYVDCPPIIIGECGRDAVEGGRGGWKKDGIPAHEYVWELAEYDVVHLRPKAKIIGACAFTAGAQYNADPQQWTEFDLDGVWPKLSQ